MLSVFVDTSAIFALLMSGDRRHRRARAAFEHLAAARAELITTSYVLVETYALLQSRIGLDAVRALRSSLIPLLEIVWVDAELHELALDDMLKRGSRSISLVDRVSFRVMQGRAILEAFAYDDDFERAGFTLVEGTF